MKIVLDTNVLIAAFATRGLCHAVFEVCIDQHEIVVSEHILKEVAATLEKKLRLPADVIDDLIQYLRENAFVENVRRPTGKICRDPSDDWILALAEQAKAEYIITGDQDLLILKAHADIPIIQPRQFWEVLRLKKNAPE